jgi:signal transduction histidine kinase
LIVAPVRQDEAASLAALNGLEVLDSEPEPHFDALVNAAAAVCGVPISAISLVDARRQWFKASLGLPGVTETPRELAFCAHAVLGEDLLEVPDALQDERFFDNPLVTGAPNIRFYAGMPLRVDGGPALGTLCVIDRQPRRLSSGQRDLLRQLALAVSSQLKGRAAVRDLKRAHADLRARRDMLELVIDAAPSLLAYWDTDLTCRFASRADVNWYGVAPEALLGKHLSELIGPHVYALNQPHLEAALRGQAQTFERALPQPSGVPRHVQVYYMPHVVDGAVAGLLVEVTDITHLKLAAAALQAESAERERAHALLLAAIDAVGEAFVLYDPDDRLVLCNEKYRNLFKFSRDLVVPGVRFEDILRNSARNGQFPEAIGRVEEWVAECMHKHRRGNVVRIQRVSNGRVLRIIDRRMPDGHTVGFRIDLSDLVRARVAAESASIAKSKFISTISHELRTPLQSIIGFSEMGAQFARDEAHARFEDLFREVHAGGHSMLTLVNALLDRSALEIRADTLKRGPCDLAALVREVMAELHPQAAEHQLRLHLSDALPPLPALADPFRMKQVLRNLLANALRFAPAGRLVEVDGRLGDDRGVEMTVRDHGPGIPPEELESIFEAFEQSSRTRDRSGGTGLGLTISRKIMAAHGGTLQAGNAPGGGAILSLRLPCTPPYRPPAPEHGKHHPDDRRSWRHPPADPPDPGVQGLPGAGGRRRRAGPGHGAPAPARPDPAGRDDARAGRPQRGRNTGHRPGAECPSGGDALGPGRGCGHRGRHADGVRAYLVKPFSPLELLGLVLRLLDEPHVSA